ncbi:MAG: hypothetical protein C7B45_01010 [Sulfobacillus acidophilus]|uniref:Transposase IS4-like domain-containing protein n=1 Tax=Sulfobacillus acidophilus TaxID=53633 RepID=A0A2T2WNT4_9FIRM|nr:MAG: hypothetical protein C7B45_01010 [Sulfobacillus acidophilus]
MTNMAKTDLTSTTKTSDLDDQWAMVINFLPKGWQDAAWTFGALTRLRAIRSAEALLRVVFAYAWNDWSWRTMAAWARRIGLANISDGAVLKRLRHASAWLGYILDPWFRSQGMGTTLTSRFRLVLTAGSTVQGPGSPGTTWRLHAQWNLGTGPWEHIELTDAHGAASLTRLQLRPPDVVVADRNDAKPNTLAWIVAQRAHVIVRFGWSALRLQTLDGKPWSVLHAVRSLPDAAPGDWWVQIPGTKDRPALKVRIVAMRKSVQAAEKARRKARKDARDHGYTVAAETLEAADYVLILTTLTKTAADAAEILELYRLRWQIEIAFKRLKSLLHIDALRAFAPDLAQTYLLAKLLGAVLVDAIRTQGPDFSPYGFPVRPDIPRRVAYCPTDLAGSTDDCSGVGESDRLAQCLANLDPGTP